MAAASARTRALRASAPTPCARASRRGGTARRRTRPALPGRARVPGPLRGRPRGHRRGRGASEAASSSPSPAPADSRGGTRSAPATSWRPGPGAPRSPRPSARSSPGAAGPPCSSPSIAPPARLRPRGRLVLDLVANDVTYRPRRAAVSRCAAGDRQGRRAPPPRGAARQRAAALRAPSARSSPPPPSTPSSADAVARALAARGLLPRPRPPGHRQEHRARGSRRAGRRPPAAPAVHRRQQRRRGPPAGAVPRRRACAPSAWATPRASRPASRSTRWTSSWRTTRTASSARELFDEAFDLLGYARRQRTQGRSRERFSNARASTTEAKELMDEARTLERKAVRAVLERAEVVCVTLASLESGLLCRRAASTSPSSTRPPRPPSRSPCSASCAPPRRARRRPAAAPAHRPLPGGREGGPRR